MRVTAKLAKRIQGQVGSSTDPGYQAVLARSLGWLFAAGVALGLGSLALPHSARVNDAAILALLAVALLVALWLLLGVDRLSLGVVQGLLVVGTGLITAGVYFSHLSTSVYALFYVLVGVYGAYFLRRRQAALQLGLVAVGYAAVLYAQAPAQERAQRWLVTIGTVCVVAVLIGLLKERIDRLISDLAAASRVDPQTGLLSRLAFHELVEVEVERARRAERPVSVIVSDLDGFRALNERLGVRAGEETLKGVAALCERAKRTIDGAARIGGQQFALVLPDSDQHGAYVLAERLRTQIHSALAKRALTASFGVASRPAHGGSAKELLGAAEQALAAAKQLGRDRTVIHSAEIAGILGGPADRRDEQQQLQLATMLTLAEVLDIRDTGTARHSQTVGSLAEAIGRQLGLPATIVERLRVAGILHDIGKIGISDAVLHKPGPLSDSQWDQMRKHPEIGAQLLAGQSFDDIRSWILAHHERPDGHGYPHQLKASEIPLEARILAVADAYEAMTNDRVYRTAIGHQAAVAELKRGMGTQFDRRVVQAFLHTRTKTTFQTANPAH